jgi:hypothetical protein
MHAFPHSLARLHSRLPAVRRGRMRQIAAHAEPRFARALGSVGGKGDCVVFCFFLFARRVSCVGHSVSHGACAMLRVEQRLGMFNLSIAFVCYLAGFSILLHLDQLFLVFLNEMQTN